MDDKKVEGYYEDWRPLKNSLDSKFYDLCQFF